MRDPNRTWPTRGLSTEDSEQDRRERHPMCDVVDAGKRRGPMTEGASPATTSPHRPVPTSCPPASWSQIHCLDPGTRCYLMGNRSRASNLVWRAPWRDDDRAHGLKL